MKAILIFFILFELTCILYLFKIKSYLNNSEQEDNYKAYYNTNFAKILIVIPAHNESSQIKNSIKAIKKANYPKNSIDIVLLNDRCTDNTQQIALEEKIKVYNLNNHEQSKGGVLHSFCSQYMNEINNYDYFCIIDSDTLIEPNFFNIANTEFKKGHKIIQGQINSIRYNKNNVSCFMLFLQLMINNFMNYQSKLKKPVIIAGKGLLISPKVLKNIKWDAKILIEDVDFSFNALLNGYFIYYCPQMKVKTKQPYTFLDMWIQQRRWTSGQKQIIKKYGRYITSNKLTGVARAFILECYLNFIIFCLITISLLDLKIFFTIILSLYICSIIIMIIVVKNTNIEYCNIINIFLFPFILFFWHLINIISFFNPEKKWKQVKNKY